ncbi:MAG: DUF928 domain-containing protein [Spirulinaceae cyanobacterium]
MKTAILRHAAFGLSCASILIAIAGILPSVAQSSQNELERRVVQYETPDLTGRGRPGDRRGGGSRNPMTRCSTARPEELVALVPVTEHSLAVEYSLETKPTFWFYIPYGPDDYHSLEFILRNDEENVHIAQLTPPTQPGVMGYTLPETAPELERDRDYNWLIVVNCENPTQNSEAVVFAQGWIQSITPSPELERELATATTPRETAQVLAQYGIWYDALTIVGNLRNQAESASWHADWEALLKAANLESAIAATGRP